MRSVPLFKYAPNKQNQWVTLIQEETPVYALKKIAPFFEHQNLYIKREDLTDSLYGGNKVRNLEFLLGEVIDKKYQNILALAPLGSNFIAALAAQASKLALPVEVHHFIPTCSKQMVKHALFSKKMGAQLKLYPGRYLSSLAQSLLYYTMTTAMSGPNTFRMPTGGSDSIGTLGPLNAFLEMLEQVEKKEIPMPEVIIVGAGTCGTMAGLLAAQKIAGVSIKIIGIRCVDKIICNTYRISQLANQTLKHLNIRTQPVMISEVDLRDTGAINYGAPKQDAQTLTDEFITSERIQLDTTYTTKVVSAMASILRDPALKKKNVLYWHTFSPSAMGEKMDLSLLLPSRLLQASLPIL